MTTGMASPRWIAAVVIAAALLLLLVASHQADAAVVIIRPPGDYGLSAAQQLQEKLNTDQIHIVLTWDQYPPTAASPELVITLGPQALADNTDRITAPLIAAFITPSDYARQTQGLSTPKTAVYSVTSPYQLLAVAQQLFGNARLGYIYTDEQDPYLQGLKRWSFNEVRVIAIPLRDQDIFKTYRHTFRQRAVDVMLITQSTELYTPGTLRYVLEALYRQKVPALALTQQLVGAGAVAAVYPSATAIIKEAASQANDFLRHRSLDTDLAPMPDPQHPRGYLRSFDMQVDHKMAAHLGIPLPPARPEPTP